MGRYLSFIREYARLNTVAVIPEPHENTTLFSLIIPISLIICLGFININHFSPGGKLGELMLFGIMIAIGFSHLVIEHEGYFHEKPYDGPMV